MKNTVYARTRVLVYLNMVYIEGVSSLGELPGVEWEVRHRASWVLFLMSLCRHCDQVEQTAPQEGRS